MYTNNLVYRNIKKSLSISLDKNKNENEKLVLPDKPPSPKEIRHYGYVIKKRQENNDIIPMSFVDFAIENMKVELFKKRYGFVSDPYENVQNSEEAYKIRKLRKSLKHLKLNDKNIWKREQMREHIECPRALLVSYYAICHILDVIFKDKPIDRFWFLETIARMPYFSYVAILHMYETLGWWELDSKLKRKHYLEEENEVHHLKIMESLGGNSKWWNRFIARHGAMAYYGVLLILFMTSPRLAYLSSELLEMHAVDTYTEFYESNASILKNLPLTEEAMKYKPDAWNLYEVFKSIAEDEYKHASNMKYIKKLPNKNIEKTNPINSINYNELMNKLITCPMKCKEENPKKID